MNRAKKRARRVSMALLAAAGAAVSLASTTTRTRAATVTWTGTISDPLSGGAPGGYTSNIAAYQGLLLYSWNSAASGTPVQNWKDTGGNPTNFTIGDTVIFDGTATGKNIYIPDDGMNPTSMTFQSANASTVYTFFRSGGSGFPGDFQKAPDDLGSTADLAAKSPWSTTGYTTTLTLDSTFLGKVILRSRPGNGANTTNSTVINGGVLEIDDGGALPANSNTNTPAVTLGGGELDINVNTQGNVQPATGQISGVLTVTDNSVLANAAMNISRVWGGTNTGTLNINAGKTLTVHSINGFRAEIGAAMTAAANLGTLRLEDVGANTTVVGLVRTNVSMPTGLLDIGVGQSEVMNILGSNGNITFGGLIGGSNTKLSGSNQSGINTTYTVGTKVADVPNGFTGTSTFDGTIRDGTGGNVSVAKQGSGTTQVLTGINSFTGSTTSSNGTLVLAGTNGSAQNSSALVVNSGGTIKLDNTTNDDDRLSTSTPIQLQGGTFEFAGNVAVGTDENVGQLQVKTLSSTVKASEVGSVTTPARITFTSLSRDTGFVDFGLDSNVKLNFTTAPTIVNGILDGAYATANGTDWATITSGGGENLITAYTGYNTDPSPLNWHPADNVRVTGGSPSITTSTTINSLKLDAGTTLTISNGSTLNLGTGGILSGSSGSASASSFTAGAGGGSLTATSQIGAMIANSGSTLTIGVPLVDSSGALALTKNGAGTMVLSATGTATGNTVVGQGALTAQATNAIPRGILTVDGGATVNMATGGSFSQTVSGVNLKNGTIAGNSTSVLTVTGSGASAINVSSGTISASLGGASAGLTKSGSGTVTLSASNSYGGGTFVSGGTLTASASGAFPNSGGALVVTGGGTVALGATSSNISTLQVGDSFVATPTLGTITGTGTLTIGSTLLAENGDVQTIIDDGGASIGVTKSAANTTNGQNTELILTNTGNTYIGVTTISVGSLNVKKLAIEGATGGVASSIGKSSNAAANLVLNGGKLRYTGSAAANGVTDRLFTLNADTIIDASGGANPLQFTNPAAMAGGGFTIQLDGNSAAATANQLGVLITDNTTTFAQTKITKKGNNTWSLTNTGNTFTGSVQLFGGILDQAIINNGGGTSGPLGTSSSAATNLVFQIGNTVSQSSGTLRYSGTGQTTDRLFFLNGAGTVDASGTGPIDFNNTGSMGGGGYLLTLTGTNTGDNTLRAQIGGDNPVNTSLTKDGVGTWVLTNPNNNYDSPTTIKAGILKVSVLNTGGSPSNIGAADNTAASLVFNSGTLQYTGGAVTTDRLFTLNNFVPVSPGTAITSTIDSSGTGAMNFNNPGDVGTLTAFPVGVDRTQFKFVAQTLLLTGSYVGTTNTLAANIGNTLITDGSAKTAFATSVSKAGAGSWRLTGALNYSGSTSVSAGTLAVANSIPRTSSVSITGGKLELEHDGNRIIKTGALSISGGKLDLHDNRLITTTSAGTASGGIYTSGSVQRMVADGRAGGTWSGNGLVTSETDAVGAAAMTTIGVATGAQALGLTGSNTGTWGGQTVTASSVLAMYTYAGDANLNGRIDGDDYFRIDSGFPAGNGYANGDFNYDGKINADDYFLIDRGYSRQFSVALASPLGGAPAGVTAVPEPASLTIVALAGFSLLARRRRRR